MTGFDPITLTVAGIPAPQGSKSAIVRNGRAVLLEGNNTAGRGRHKSWRQAVAQAARDWLAEHPRQPIAEPVSVSMTFRFPPVASDPYRHLHVTKPDLSKLQRSTEDALVDAGLLVDDRYIAAYHFVEKRYCQAGEATGATIDLISLADREQQHRDRAKFLAADRRRQLKKVAS